MPYTKLMNKIYYGDLVIYWSNLKEAQDQNLGAVKPKMFNTAIPYTKLMYKILLLLERRNESNSTIWILKSKIYTILLKYFLYQKLDMTWNIIHGMAQLTKPTLAHWTYI